MERSNTSLQLIDDAVVADDAAFVPGTSKVMMVGFEFDDTAPDSVNEGDAGAARMSARREVYVQIRDAAGNERGLNIAADGSLQAALNGGTTTVFLAAGTVDAGTFQPYAQPSSRWSYAAGAGGIVNTTTAVTFKAADATLRNYITNIQIMAEALTNATELAIRDGVAGTVLWRTKIGTGGLTNGLSIDFISPLRGTAATLLEVVTLTASGAGAVYFNAQGYTAA